MTELTKNMRPFCVGRFIVDTPVDAQIRTFGQSIEGMGTITVRSNISKNRFLSLASQKELTLQATSHRKEGTVLREALHMDGQDARILVFRDDAYSTRTNEIYGYFWRDMTGFKFAYSADNERVEEAKADLLKAFGVVKPRGNNEIPDKPGLCIDNAFIPGQGYQAEDVGVVFTLPSYPGMEFKALFNTVERPEEEGLLERGDRNMPAVRDLHPDVVVSTPRKGKRILADMQGEEIVEVLQPGKPDAAILATWEFHGEARSIVRPMITLNLIYSEDGDMSRVRKPSADTLASKPPKPLSNDEAMALWDAFAQSLRPRPGAL